jgi:divinyl chlorophyllide a 8-vinyl-reductase
VTCIVRNADAARVPAGVTVRQASVTDRAAMDAVMAGAGYHGVVSCLASRTGAPQDAWAIDHGAQATVLAAAKAAGIPRFVLLSAICVQKPRLEFQRAKLAFEAELMASGLVWSIVRPTAFFKSLSGQVARLRAGKTFLLFGDGALTACKPISDDDLGRFLALCLTDPGMRNRILPVGGPGPALTPRAQGEMLFEALGMAPRFRHVPVALMNGIVGVSAALGQVSGRWADRAEFARTGRYYATESMLVWDEARGRYDAEATPEFGTETLADHYRRIAAGEAKTDLREHAVF